MSRILVTGGATGKVGSDFVRHVRARPPSEEGLTLGPREGANIGTGHFFLWRFDSWYPVPLYLTAKKGVREG
jgi:hypothetical protein